MYPIKPPQLTLLEHLEIITPTLIILGVLLPVILIFGWKHAMNLLFGLVVLIVVILSLITLYLSPIQFLILLLPIIASYIFTQTLAQNKNILEKINIGCLILSCQIILLTEFLSLLKELNAKNFLIGVSLLFIFSLAWIKNIKKVFKDDLNRLIQLKIRFFQLIENHRLLKSLVLALLISCLWRMLLIAYIPPNSFDSMTYHLSRIAYWLQHQSMEYFPTHNIRQVIFPFNGEILMMWTMIASKLDYLCGFIQFAGYLLSGTLLYQCLRRVMNIRASSALWVTLIWYALPINVLASTQAKNNLMAAYFVMSSLVYFLISFSQGACRKYLILSALSLALSLGTKTSALYFLFPFSLYVLYLLLARKLPVKLAVLWTTFLAVFCVFFGAYSYLQNIIHHRNPFGPADISLIKIIHPSWKTCLSVYAQHLFNIAVNQTGLQFYCSTLSDFYNDAAAMLGTTLFNWLHIPVNISGTFSRAGFLFNNWTLKFSINEQYAFMGILGPVLLLTIAYTLFKAIISREGKWNNIYLLFACLFLGYLFALSWTTRWDPWNSRHLIIIMLVAFPLMAVIFDSGQRLLNKLSAFLTVYSILLLIPTTFMDELKPLTAYKLDRWGLKYAPLNRQEGRNFYLRYEGPVNQYERINGVGWSHLTRNTDRVGLRNLMRPDQEVFERKINELIPFNAKVGLLYNYDQWDYPIFGNRLARTVVPIGKDAILSDSFDYIIATHESMTRNPEITLILKNKYEESQYLGWTGDGRDMTLYVPKP